MRITQMLQKYSLYERQVILSYLCSSSFDCFLYFSSFLIFVQKVVDEDGNTEVRNGFWIHIDSPVAGIYAPFLQRAKQVIHYNKNTTWIFIFYFCFILKKLLKLIFI